MACADAAAVGGVASVTAIPNYDADQALRPLAACSTNSNPHRGVIPKRGYAT